MSASERSLLPFFSSTLTIYVVICPAVKFLPDVVQLSAQDTSETLRRSAGCTKSPFRAAKTGSSHTTCFLKQHVLISLLQHVQDMRLVVNSSTSITRQITLEREKRGRKHLVSIEGEK